MAMCLLVALCVLPMVKSDDTNFGDGLDNYRNYVSKTTLDVKEKCDKLLIDNVNYFFIMPNIAQMMRIKVNATFDEKVATELNKIQKTIDDVQAKGKNIDDCLKNNTKEVEHIKTEFNKEIDRSIALGIHIYHISLKLTTGVIKEGYTLFKNIHQIFATCYLSIGPPEICISSKIAGIKSRVQKFRQNYDLSIKVRQSAIEQHIDHNAECIRNATYIFEQKLNILITDLMTCINANE
ncbi:hypothetical protein KM043_018603 [Ampulex compressa]|nr:hypothetical protein KM043_018603 [Ampulex compressa]